MTLRITLIISAINPKGLELKAVNLDETKNIISVLETQKQKIDQIEDLPVHFHKISFWTILIYIIIAFIVFYAIYMYFIKKKKTQAPTNPAEEIRLGLQGIASTLKG